MAPSSVHRDIASGEEGGVVRFVGWERRWTWMGGQGRQGVKGRLGRTQEGFPGTWNGIPVYIFM